MNTGIKSLYFILQIRESNFKDSGQGEHNNGFKRNDLVLTIRCGLSSSEAGRRKIDRGDVF